MDSPESTPEHDALIDNCARRIARELRLQSIELPELVSYGWIGLRKAQKRFDPSFGVKFEAYAYLRVRYAILDGICELAPFSRRAHTARELQRMDEAVDVSLAAAPKRDDDDDDDPSAILEDLDGVCGALGMSAGLSAWSASASDQSSEDANIRRIDGDTAASAIRWLPDRARRVVEGLYFQGLTLEKIASASKHPMSKSDAGRAHLEGLKLLRARLSP